MHFSPTNLTKRFGKTCFWKIINDNLCKCLYTAVQTCTYGPIIWHMILTGDWTKSLSKALWGKTNTWRRGANTPGRHLWKQRRKTAEITAQRAFDCGRNPFCTLPRKGKEKRHAPGLQPPAISNASQKCFFMAREHCASEKETCQGISWEDNVTVLYFF